MAKADLNIRKLDLAARAVDLTTALMHATGASNSLFRGAWEIGQWLGRERLNQYELQDCMEKSKGLVFANKNGQKLFDNIIEGGDLLAVGPLFLQQSGSLGRLMAGDPSLNWMISTVACLFQYHRDDRFVAQTLTAFIMRAHFARQPDHVAGIQDSLTYNHEHTKVGAVVGKIVSSIWYNVVNAGCDTISLPNELLSVCRKGHYLDPSDFSIIIHTLYSQCPSKAILRSDHLLRDVTLWLLLHYDGALVVNVGGKIVYKTDLGRSGRELEIHAKSACLEGEDCGRTGRESYEILQHVAGKFEQFLSGSSFGFSEQVSQPGIRQNLYEIPRPYPRDSAMWNKKISILVKSTAQSMMRWLLSIPLSSQQDFSDLGFSAFLGSEMPKVPPQTIISTVLRRIPAMINLDWGISSASDVIFKDMPRTESYFPHTDKESQKSAHREALEHLLGYFPILQDLLTKIKPDCLCGDCHGGIASEGSRWGLKFGCLGRTALEEVFVFLAHGIADGFNVKDVSSVADITPICGGMTVVLLELVQERKVCWDSWFALASSVYLGCPFECGPPSTHPAFGGTAFAAIQYGNLAAQAPWLDLSKELSVSGCFELVGSRGRLGVITRSQDHYAQFRSVEDNFAIIETENTEDTSPFNSRFKKKAALVDSKLVLEDDQSSVESDVILIPIEGKFYRLWLRIRTSSHWRVVDPSDALSAVIRMLPSNSCQHEAGGPEVVPTLAKVYTMEEVVGRWPDTVQSYAPRSASDGDANPRAGTLHITHVLDTHFKQNVALALSVCTTAIQSHREWSCFACSLSYAKQMKRQPLRDGEAGNILDRYIIYLKHHLSEAKGNPPKRLMGKEAQSDDVSHDPASGNQ